MRVVQTALVLFIPEEVHGWVELGRLWVRLGHVTTHQTLYYGISKMGLACRCYLFSFVVVASVSCFDHRGKLEKGAQRTGQYRGNRGHAWKRGLFSGRSRMLLQRVALLVVRIVLLRQCFVILLNRAFFTYYWAIREKKNMRIVLAMQSHAFFARDLARSCIGVIPPSSLCLKSLESVPTHSFVLWYYYHRTRDEPGRSSKSGASRKSNP
jgi:hypothetical protein